jgi:hypothetical protein
MREKLGGWIGQMPTRVLREQLTEIISEGVTPDLITDQQFVQCYVETGQQRTSEEEEAVDKWLDQELRAGNIKKTVRQELQVVLPIFTVPKKAPGEFRVVHNLKQFNAFCQHKPFKLSSVKLIREAWIEREWGFTLDLKDAFRHLHIKPEYQSMFGFSVPRKNGVVEYYCQVALPFGWNLSPYYWNLVTQAIQIMMHQRGLLATIYVDDIAILCRSEEEGTQHAAIARQILQQMGIAVNEAKSAMKPAHVIHFLGYVIDLQSKTITISQQKRFRIRHLAARELKAQITTRARIARLIGTIQGAREALQFINPQTSLLYRFLYTNRDQPWNTPLQVWSSMSRELRYWAALRAWQANRSYQSPKDTNQRSIVVYSDASVTGYGLQAREETTQKIICHLEEQWTMRERLENHSTEKELQTINRGLQMLSEVVPRGARVVWFSDCMAAVSVARKFRSRSPHLFKVGLAMAWLVAKMRWQLEVYLIPRELNQLADDWSRAISGLYFDTSTRVREEIKVQLQLQAQHQPQSKWIEPFRYGWNSQFDVMGRWHGQHMWLEPPIPLVNATVSRLMREQSTIAILVIPEWYKKHWWQPLMSRARLKYQLPQQNSGLSCPKAPWRRCAIYVNC